MEKKPTALELEVLSRLWELGGTGTVNDVLAGWQEKPLPGYTTVLKILQIMERKGYVSHSRAGRAYRYTALLRREEHSRGRLRELVDKLFLGSRLELVSALVEEMDLTPEEIRQIRKMLAGKSKGKK